MARAWGAPDVGLFDDDAVLAFGGGGYYATTCSGCGGAIKYDGLSAAPYHDDDGETRCPDDPGTGPPQ